MTLSHASADCGVAMEERKVTAHKVRDKRISDLFQVVEVLVLFPRIALDVRNN